MVCTVQKNVGLLDCHYIVTAQKLSGRAKTFRLAALTGFLALCLAGLPNLSFVSLLVFICLFQIPPSNLVHSPTLHPLQQQSLWQSSLLLAHTKPVTVKVNVAQKLQSQHFAQCQWSLW